MVGMSWKGIFYFFKYRFLHYMGKEFNSLKIFHLLWLLIEASASTTKYKSKPIICWSDTMAE